MIAQRTQYSDFSTAALSYGKPHKKSDGTVSMCLQTSATDLSNPCVWLEKCSCLYGIREPMEAGRAKWIDLALTSSALLQWLSELDDKNVSMVAAKNNISKEEVATEHYRPFVKKSRTGYDPYISIQIDEDEVGEIFLLHEGAWGPWERGTLQDVRRHCKVQPIVELKELWFTNDHDNLCGMTMVATDLLVWPTTSYEE